MGSVIAKALDENVFSMTICERDPEKRKRFQADGFDLCADLSAKLLSSLDIVLLSVKPKDVPAVLSQLKCCSTDILLLSIAAGIPVATLRKYSGLKKIVRIMPNTPALIGEGISGWFATKEVRERMLVRKILLSLGDAIELPSETLIDAVTVISGSGPAYVFLFMESLIAAAERLGLSRKDSKHLVLKTVEGAATLARLSPEDLSTLRERVASKGGTTEAALTIFQKRRFAAIMNEAVQKAYERAKELGKGQESR